MSLEIGKVYATVDGDTRLFSRSMGFVRKEGESTAKYVARSFNQVGDAFQSLGKKLTLGLTVPLVAGLTAGVREAALLEGAIAKFDVVFRGVNDEMHAFVDNFRSEFPIARSEIVKSAAALQDLMVPMGVNRKEAAGMTQDWLKLAGALSAFNDVPIQEVLVAIESGLAGSSEPLRRFGIDARETALQQTALAHGLMDANQAMTTQVRTQALLIQATNQSSDAINGLEEQKGSLLWVIQGLKADLADLAGSFGAVLLPQVTRVAGGIRDALGAFNSLNDQTKAVMVTVAGFGAALGPVLFGLGTLVKILPLIGAGFAALTGPIGLTVAAAAGGALLIYKNWDMIREFFTTGAGAKMFDSIRRTAETAFSAIVTTVENAIGVIMFAWNTFGESIVGVLGRNLERVMSIIVFAFDQINSYISVWSNLFTGNFAAAWQEIQNIAMRSVNFVLDIVSRMYSGLLTMVANLLAAINTLESVQNAANKAAEGIENLADSLKFTVTETERAAFAAFDLRSALGGLFKDEKQVAEGADEIAKSVSGATRQLEDFKRSALAITGEEGASIFPSVPEIQSQAAEIRVAMGYVSQGNYEIGQGAQFAMQIANEFTNSFGQGMANVIVQGEKLVDTLRNIGKLLLSSAIQRGIGLLLSGGLSGAGFFGSGGGLIGKIFGRASGGSVLQGQPYMVGEQGPELFVPNVTGTIQPNGAGASSISVTMRPVVVPIIGYDGLAVRIQQSTSDLSRRGGV